MIEFLCQIEINTLHVKLFNIPGIFNSYQIKNLFILFKHKLSNSKFFMDSSFLATLIVHTHMYTINKNKIKSYTSCKI